MLYIVAYVAGALTGPWLFKKAREWWNHKPPYDPDKAGFDSL